MGLVKKYAARVGVGGPEQRGSRSSVFELLERGVQFNFQLPMGVGHPILSGLGTHILT